VTLRRLLAFLLLALPACAGGLVVQMRPRAHGSAPADADLRARLEAHVRALAYPRNDAHPDGYAAAAAYLRAAWPNASPEPVGPGDNWIHTLPGGPEVLVVGAHYDSCGDTPGADDNASGVAVMLEVARLLAGRTFPRTVRFVAFANEEPPYFQTALMGSLVHARNARERGDDIAMAISIESVGYFSDEPGSQRWPVGLGLLFTDRGDFLNVVGDLRSASAVRAVTAALREGSLPIAGGAVPAAVPGVDWSDHWSFWQAGYPAVMVTDMPPFRNPHYHEPTDTPDKLDYDRLARFTAAMAAAVERLAAP
jgi:hypothetical protein